MLVCNFLQEIINMEVLFCEVVTFLLFSAIQRLNMSPLVDIIIKIDDHSQTQKSKLWETTVPIVEIFGIF